MCSSVRILKVYLTAVAREIAVKCSLDWSTENIIYDAKAVTYFILFYLKNSSGDTQVFWGGTFGSGCSSVRGASPHWLL